MTRRGGLDHLEGPTGPGPATVVEGVVCTYCSDRGPHVELVVERADTARIECQSCGGIFDIDIDQAPAVE